MTSESGCLPYPSSRFRRIVLSVTLGVSLLSLVATPGGAATTKSPLACQQFFTEVVNVDKLYIALQYGVVKSNSKQIANMPSANVNGQLVGDPQKMTTFKPVGLLK